jgi:hypothetical protein
MRAAKEIIAIVMNIGPPVSMSTPIRLRLPVTLIRTRCAGCHLLDTLSPFPRQRPARTNQPLSLQRPHKMSMSFALGTAAARLVFGIGRDEAVCGFAPNQGRPLRQQAPRDA